MSPDRMRLLASTLRAIVILFGHIPGAFATGDPNQTYTFNLPPGEAAYRLNDFSTQSGLQILFDFGSMRGVPITPVNGAMKPFEALEKMIHGTGIKYEFINRRTVTLTRSTHSKPPSRKSGARASRLTFHGEPRASDAEIPQVVIRADLRDETLPVGSAVISLSRKELESSNAIGVPSLLRTVPQIFGGGPTEDTFEFGFEAPTNIARGSGINLRGLAASSTLVLMNGHRLATGGTEGFFVDVASLPIDAIERIDILPGSSSIVYGADAVAGVVNFTMRDHFQGQETTAHYGASTRGAPDQFHLSHLLGRANERTRFFIAADYLTRQRLAASDRSRAAVELRTPGEPADNRRQEMDGNANEGDILPLQERLALYASAGRSLSDHVHLAAEVLVGRRISSGRYGGTAAENASPRIDEGRLALPATGDYALSEEFPLTRDARVTTAQLSAGLEWQLDDRWTFLASGGYATEQLRSQLRHDDDSRTQAFLRRIGQGTEVTSDSHITSGRLGVRGPALHTSAGTALFIAGAESRRQSFNSSVPASCDAPSNRTETTRSVSAAFAEVAVPLTANRHTDTGPSVLEASIGLRHERYSDFGSATVPRLGLSWTPWQRFHVRGTWSGSFRPPGLADRDERSNGYAIVGLPTEDGNVADVLIWSGKNRSVREERARSWTVGVDVEPSRPSGIGLALTYFDTELRRRLTTPALTADLLIRPDLSDLVVRNPSSTYRMEVCSRTLTGNHSEECLRRPIAAIADLRVHNTARTLTRGIDALVRYAKESGMGRFAVDINGTYVFRFAESSRASMPLQEKISTRGHPIDFRARGTAEWQRGATVASVSVNYFDDYRDAVRAFKFHRWTTVDIQLTRTFSPTGRRTDDSMAVTLAAMNVMDSDPSFLANRVGYDRENADVTGRLITLSVKRKW